MRRLRVDLIGLPRPCFARTQTWQQAMKYTAALASDLPKRSGWTIAQYVGDRTPNRTQRLLNRAVWDGEEAMSLVRRFAVEGLSMATRRRRRGLVVGVLDETGRRPNRSHSVRKEGLVADLQSAPRPGSAPVRTT